MAEKAQKVIELSVKEGGVQLGSNGTQTTLPRQLRDVEMTLSTNPEGVFVRFPHRLQDGKIQMRTLLVPMSHIKHLEVES